MEAILFSIAAFFSTYLGGLFSLRFKEKLHIIMSFAAGILLGVFSFEVLPEIINEVKINDLDPLWAMIAFVCGFMFFHIIEKSILIHHAQEEAYAIHKHPNVGIFSAIALASHSFVDGLGIGLGFQVSEATGLLVTLAVISHDFTDGMNTVTLLLSHKNKIETVKRFLFLDALAPILGAVSTLIFKLPHSFLVLYLGFFGGFLMYIGASDILPEAHSEQSSLKLIGLTIMGLLFVFAVTRLV